MVNVLFNLKSHILTPFWTPLWLSWIRIRIPNTEWIRIQGSHFNTDLHGSGSGSEKLIYIYAQDKNCDVYNYCSVRVYSKGPCCFVGQSKLNFYLMFWANIISLYLAASDWSLYNRIIESFSFPLCVVFIFYLLQQGNLNGTVSPEWIGLKSICMDGSTG